jgi:hypothetical protein
MLAPDKAHEEWKKSPVAVLKERQSRPLRLASLATSPAARGRSRVG